MGKIKDAWKYAPIGSLANLLDKKDPKSQKELAIRFAECVGHLAWAIVPPALLFNYVLGGFNTDSWNPIEQRRIFAERKAEQANLQQRYTQLEQDIFNPKGLADTNYDGKVDAGELVNAYERMDLDSVTVLPARDPTMRELEMAKGSYILQREKENENFIW